MVTPTPSSGPAATNGGNLQQQFFQLDVRPFHQNSPRMLLVVFNVYGLTLWSLSDHSLSTILRLV